MASTGEELTYKEYEERANGVAHFLRDVGLQPLDHIATFTENNIHLLETEAGRRTHRPVLHLHQLVPVARRGGLHRQRLDGASGVHNESEARRRAAAARAVSQR